MIDYTNPFWEWHDTPEEGKIGFMRQDIWEKVFLPEIKERRIHMAVKKINLNTEAREVTLAEGLKKSINIGQVKETQRLTYLRQKKWTVEQFLDVMNRVK